MRWQALGVVVCRSRARRDSAPDVVTCQVVNECSVRIVEVERGRAPLKSLHKQLQAIVMGTSLGMSSAIAVDLRSAVRPHKRARTGNGGVVIDAVAPKKARSQLGQWAEVALLTVLGHPRIEELEGVAMAAAPEHDANDAVVQLRG